MACVIDFIKARLEKGCIYSIPKQLIQDASVDNYRGVANEVTCEGMLSAICPGMHEDDCAVSAAFLGAESAGEATRLQYFELVDPYPERKYLVRAGHLAKRRTTVIIKWVSVRTEGDRAVMELGRGSKTDLLDLRAWCSESSFPLAMQCLRKHSAAASGMSVALKASMCMVSKIYGE